MKLRPGHRIDGLDGPLGTLDALVLAPGPTHISHLLVALDDAAGGMQLVPSDRLAVVEGEPRLLVHAELDPAATKEPAPAGTWAIRQDAEVHDSAGTRLGRVNEFFLDPSSAVITHLIVHEVHHLQHQELRIPIAAIADVQGDVVRLDLGRKQLAARSRSAG